MRTLVVGPAWVGDMVMAQPLCAELALQGAALDVLAPAASAAIAERMPGVATVRQLPLDHGQLGLRVRHALGCELRGIYGQAVVLPNSWKSALVPWFAAVPRRRGWRGEQRFFLLNEQRRLDPQGWPRMVDRFMALAASDFRPALAAGAAPVLRSDRAAGQQILRDHGADCRAPLVALCPGAAFGAAKRWPIEQFAQLAEQLHARGWRPVVLGSAADRSLGAAISSALPEALDLCGHTSLPEVLDVLAACTVAVSNDSGLMHIAGAVATPVVALYGSTSPDFTPPLGTATRILQQNLPCQPCFRRECPLPPGAGHLRCLRDLSVATVLASVEDLARCGS